MTMNQRHRSDPVSLPDPVPQEPSRGLARRFLWPALRNPKVAGGLLLGAAGVVAWRCWQMPKAGHRVVSWRLQPKEWAGRDPCRIVVLSDLRAGGRNLSAKQIAALVARANAYRPDVAVILGAPVTPAALARDGAPLDDLIDAISGFDGTEGRFAVLGYESDIPRKESRDLLDAAGIPVIDGKAIRVGGAKRGFWLAGACAPISGQNEAEIDAAEAGVAKSAMRFVTDDAPVILLAQDPMNFATVEDLPRAVPVQISGQFPGSQMHLPDDADFYRWGRYDEDGRTLIVSGGVGAPVGPKLGRQEPEITVIDLNEPEGW